MGDIAFAAVAAGVNQRASSTKMDLKKISGAAFFALAVVACLAVMSSHQVEEDIKYFGDSLSSESFAATDDEIDSRPTASSRLFDDAMDDDGSDDEGESDSIANDALHPSLSALSADQGSDEEDGEEEVPASSPHSALDDLFSGNSETEDQPEASSSNEGLSNGDQVTVQYRLRLPDGTTVMNQWGDGDGGDFSFELGAHHVIPGFEQAVSGMSVGQTMSDISIPADEAYGAKGGPGIGPDQDLVYDIKVVAKN